MKRVAFKVVTAAALVAFGWVAAQAQNAQNIILPDFEMVFDVPVGDTHITCKGCQAGWLNSRNIGEQILLRCDTIASGPQRCTGRVLVGWIKR